MIMPVMHIRYVVMVVLDGLVSVRVDMWLAWGIVRVVRMIVMFVVRVGERQSR
jgi:hypothetical protein